MFGIWSFDTSPTRSSRGELLVYAEYCDFVAHVERDPTLVSRPSLLEIR